jgi:hypothetical protein
MVTNETALFIGVGLVRVATDEEKGNDDGDDDAAKAAEQSSATQVRDLAGRRGVLFFLFTFQVFPVEVDISRI